jgi:hypothetical protein
MVQGKPHDAVFFFANTEIDSDDCVANNENYDEDEPLSTRSPTEYAEVVEKELQYCIAWALALDDMEDAGIDPCAPMRLIHCTGTNSRSCNKDVLPAGEDISDPFICCPDDDPTNDPDCCVGDDCEEELPEPTEPAGEPETPAGPSVGGDGVSASCSLSDSGSTKIMTGLMAFVLITIPLVIFGVRSRKLRVKVRK